MSAITRLIAACDRRGLDWWLASDRSKATPEYRFECRVHETDDQRRRTGPVRIVERGSTAYEAAAKVADQVEALP